ncbi:MAG: hypothetical protein KAH05_02860 [Clostridiales bacterium]|nr:hypothetical protein [Clostridiales bacterium]
MFNKLHYDAKFVTLLAPATNMAVAIDTGDKNFYVRDADRVAIIIQGLAASVDKIHTITVDRVDVAGANDTAINFDIAKITTATGVYGTWTECAAATGLAIEAATLTDGTHAYIIELDSAQFISNDDYATNYDYISVKIATSGVDGGTFTGSITGILYGLKYQNTV